MPRPRAFDELDVVRRAREVFHDRGFATTSVDHLTAATGLSRSSLYGAFGDKRGVFIRAFSDYLSEQGQRLSVELAGDDEGARARLRSHLLNKTADPVASRRGCLLAKSVAELAADDAEVAAMGLRFYDTYERLLTDCVRGAQRSGDLRRDLDAADAGALLLAALRGIEALGRAGRPEAELERIADAAIAALDLAES